ncbi:hypothetical protein [uncultured Methanobrevibacter sp.]|uniref:hypothetical protein n=1 Tax=uncultured Methanobrevibacter sp. TaxID=253161 RepID=UPI002601FFF4|nr:hypothetical protein [uncultured Methanobrevibacter sp.]
MYKKNLIIILLFLIIGLGIISSVNANDLNHTNEIVGEEITVDDNLVSVDKSVSDNLIYQNSNDESIKTTSKTFTDLNNVINGNVDDDIYLDSTYTFDIKSDDDFKQGISISRGVTVWGNGFTINGDGVARIFIVGDSDAVFHDIVFVNGKSGNGGAICGGCSCVNCTFINNSANYSGGAIYGGCSCVNCTFINNSANYNGGALEDGSSTNCTFINNSAHYGGALGYGSSTNCTFINNSAVHYGGAIYNPSGIGADPVNCTFINNSAADSGGAIYGPYNFDPYSKEYCAVNCNFINNSAHYGGAMFYGSCVNCSFISNHAVNGGAIYGPWGFDSYSEEYFAVNCSFVNNYAFVGGAVSDCSCVNCSFISNHADYGGAVSDCSCVNCSFISNHADYGGALLNGFCVNCSFISNRADYGGAILYVYNYKGQNLNSFFKDNKASISGDNVYKQMIFSIFVPSSVTTVYNGGKYVVATLKDEYGNLVKGVKVTVKFLNVKTLILVTDKKGQIKVSTDDLSPKKYTLSITYDEFAVYVKVTVKKSTPKLTAKSKTFKKSLKTKKYSVTLKTNQNEVMKNTKVTIKVNKKTFIAKTNKKGVATFRITKLTKKGNFKATITYGGNECYNKVTKKVNINCK